VKYVIVIPAARAGIVTARLATMATDATTANNLNFFTVFSFEVSRFDHPVQTDLVKTFLALAFLLAP